MIIVHCNLRTIKSQFRLLTCELQPRSIDLLSFSNSSSFVPSNFFPAPSLPSTVLGGALVLFLLCGRLADDRDTRRPATASAFVTFHLESGVMSLEIDFILEQVREILGASCDPQLRLVSKRCNAVMQRYPRQDLQVCNFVSSGSLLLWAKKTLKMRWKGICDEIVKAGCLDTLKWARAQKRPAAWTKCTASETARGGHLEVGHI
jgi:hypothetical protein